jgi:hypothetical protein
VLPERSIRNAVEAYAGDADGRFQWPMPWVELAPARSEEMRAARTCTAVIGKGLKRGKQCTSHARAGYDICGSHLRHCSDTEKAAHAEAQSDSAANAVTQRKAQRPQALVLLGRFATQYGAVLAASEAWAFGLESEQKQTAPSTSGPQAQTSEFRSCQPIEVCSCHLPVGDGGAKVPCGAATCLLPHVLVYFARDLAPLRSIRFDRPDNPLFPLCPELNEGRSGHTPAFTYGIKIAPERQATADGWGDLGDGSESGDDQSEGGGSGSVASGSAADSSEGSGGSIVGEDDEAAALSQLLGLSQSQITLPILSQGHQPKLQQPQLQALPRPALPKPALSKPALSVSFAAPPEFKTRGCRRGASCAAAILPVAATRFIAGILSEDELQGQFGRSAEAGAWQRSAANVVLLSASRETALGAKVRGGRMRGRQVVHSSSAAVAGVLGRAMGLAERLRVAWDEASSDSRGSED